jgi:DNA-binding CsgD family transcriptional regulator
MDTSGLRPLERRILRLAGEGLSDEEIARRFRRSPAFIRRVIDLTDVPRSGTARAAADAQTLRPLERRVLRWRETGAAPDEIGPRFNRSGAFISRVEGLANHKLAEA